MLKDLVYLGVGSALLAKEKIDKEIAELVEKGKVSKEEAKELAQSAKSRAKEEEEKMKQKLKELIKEVIDEMGIATKDDIKELIKDICENKESKK